jgi:hypothetical protein
MICSKYHNLYQQDTELVKGRRKGEIWGGQEERRMRRKTLEGENNKDAVVGTGGREEENLEKVQSKWDNRQKRIRRITTEIRRRRK